MRPNRSSAYALCFGLGMLWKYAALERSGGLAGANFAGEFQQKGRTIVAGISIKTPGVCRLGPCVPSFPGLRLRVVLALEYGRNSRAGILPRSNTASAYPGKGA